MNVAPMNGHKPAPVVLNKPRARRDAARMLGLALMTRYRKLLDASGEDETVVATADLAQCMYENIEFVIWALKSLGGLNPPLPEELKKVTPPQFAPVAAESMKTILRNTADDPRFAKPPAPVLEEEKKLDLPCNCPVLEHGIMNRNKHMTSCPKYVP